MLNRQVARTYLEAFDFESLFIEELGWDVAERVRLPFEVEGEDFEVVAIAQKRSFLVYQCFVAVMPVRAVRVKLDRLLTGYSKSHLLVFGDEGRTEQVWMWLKPEAGKAARVRSHAYRVKQNPEALLQKLEALGVSFAEEDGLTHVDVVGKVKRGFDVEQVTKQFFRDFEGLHQRLCVEIEGIEGEGDRRWYASVLLNRLMFVYFLQRRYFLDRGDVLYLQNKLKGCEAVGESFYEFLKDLFFVGFAQPEYERDLLVRGRLGEICYLNGGLFLRHSIEQQYPEIRIKNGIFSEILRVFTGYSWHLDDRPDKDSNEINPDVLGYIFEKYINQKEFGAYYTRPEITEYLCDRTINKLVLDRANGLGYTFNSLDELLAGLDGVLCGALLGRILPQLTLLDPACGSGAFLVAAMKTLIGIYEGVVARSDQFGDRVEIAEWLRGARLHPSLAYYIKKRIITDNLYGVDIMEEATEIAKLRLFLALVAAAKRVEDLEPLPNVDFNIMAGNSLIGLIRVDGEGFDRLGGHQKRFGVDPTQINLLGPTVVQGNLLQPLVASEYERILADKNRSVDLYKKHAFLGVDSELPQEARLLQLRDHIERLNRESQVKLNELLLNEFSERLGIKYEEAQLKGKAVKRLLTMGDIAALKPFHWGYHFDAVFERGGFDAIIANPPWEVFQTDEKEFFQRYDDLIRKNKLDIKAWNKQRDQLLKDPDIQKAWLSYCSQFPHVSQYFKKAEQYLNQRSIMGGKSVARKINLYCLFIEQCFNLLRPGGECGIVIPSGIYTDLGAKQLREMLFSQTEVTGLFCFENRKMIFEGVDSRFKFVILSFEKGRKTEAFPVRFMRHDVAELANFPAPDDIVLDVPLIRQLSPDSLSVMEFKQPIDITIAQKMLQFPLLGEEIEGKWNLKLTAEFHMTNDSHLFKTEPAPGRLPLYEGKMIHQFDHQWGQPKYWLDESDVRSKLLKRGEADTDQILAYQMYKLGFRDIARNTDQRTAIITMLPKGVCCNHKIPTAIIYNTENQPCLKSQLFFCCILNSFIIDYLLRQRVTTNLTFFFLYQLPVPRLQEGDPWFAEIVDRAAKLICTTPEYDELAAAVGLGSHHNSITDPTQRAQLRAQLDGIIAHLYSLTEAEFIHILSTFPIVSEQTKQAALNAYGEIS
ncbi:MAG: ATP-binding protein [Spirulina sp. DLM2.Bin59]|nr:MAG: ATP-binding protein [Spirulina sp. DLM2.Bin59]